MLSSRAARSRRPRFAVGPRRGARTVSVATSFLLGVVLVAALGAVRPVVTRAGDPAEGSSACGIPGLLDDEDEGLRVAYDGLRRGLEEANLPRICLRHPQKDDDASWARLATELVLERPPFVVALGRRVGARLASLTLDGPTGRIPCVYVDVASVVAGRSLPAAPHPPSPCAIVRAEVAVEGWGTVLRGLLPGRPQPTVLLPWSSESKEALALRNEAAAGGGFEVHLASEGPAAADAILDWAPGVGETVDSFSSMAARSRTLRIPLLSGDRGRFSHGAAVVRVADAGLLGRVAAEAARRLKEGEGRDVPLRLAVRTTEVWVDLEAADAEGLVPPLPFLASADRLRRPLPISPPERKGR